MKKIKKIILVIFAALFIACGIYVSDYYHYEESENISYVQVDKRTITVGDENAENAIIFYPGGKVEYKAYLPLLNELSKEGFFCVLKKVPFNLAVLDVNAADGIKDDYPGIKNWYIAGHSLGGSMAASYISKHADEYKGLILLASYSTSDLSETGLRVLSVYGSNDGVMQKDKYEKYFNNLPENTKEKVIEGGNHCNFGDYGFQKGDNPSNIDSKIQAQITSKLIREFVDGE